MDSTARRALVIACGAIAREIVALCRANAWHELDITCLPAELHNRPERIPEAVRAAIRENRPVYSQMFVAYADCGTGGRLDAVLREEGVDRLPGAHCYDFYATPAVFAALAEAEPGTFYLTDFLLQHYDRLVTQGLGLDRHPELAQQYFGNYKRLMYLAQTKSGKAQIEAQAIAARMGLNYEYRFTGYGELAVSLANVARRREAIQWAS